MPFLRTRSIIDLKKIGKERQNRLSLYSELFKELKTAMNYCYLAQLNILFF